MVNGSLVIEVVADGKGQRIVGLCRDCEQAQKAPREKPTETVTPKRGLRLL